MPDRPPLRNYAHSRAVVMGNWDYAHLPPVLAAGNSLERMVGLLTGPLCGWPEDRMLVLANERGPGDLPDRVITAFEDVTDVALFYFVGHGQIDAEGQLCLGLADSRTEHNRRAATSLPFQAVRRALLDSDAATKIVILDCCFAGLASQPVNTLAGSASDVLDMASGAGAYTMAASGAYTTAWYEDDPDVPRPQTFFTRYLADLVESGIPGQAPGLQLHRLFTRLRDNLSDDGKPVPCERSVDAARDFVFAYNAAPPETLRDPDAELRQLNRQVAEIEARRVREQAEALAREQALRAEAAERTRELERLQEQARRSQTMAAGQQRQLQDAIEAAGRRLDETTAAQAAAAAERPDPATDAVTDPATDFVTDPATDPATDAVTDPGTDAVTDPATDAVTDPATDPATDFVTDPATDAVTNPATDYVTDPATDAVTNPVGDAVTNPVGDFVTGPVGNPVADPAGGLGSPAAAATLVESARSPVSRPAVSAPAVIAPAGDPPASEGSPSPASDGPASPSPASGGAASNGPVSGGPVSGGAASDGTASDGTASDGTASDGTASDGTASEVTGAPRPQPLQTAGLAVAGRRRAFSSRFILLGGLGACILAAGLYLLLRGSPTPAQSGTTSGGQHHSIPSAAPETTLTGPRGYAVYGVAFSPDGNALAAGLATAATSDSPGGTYLWNVSTHDHVASLIAPNPLVSFDKTLGGLTHSALTMSEGTGIFAVAFSPAGATLAAGEYGSIDLWNPNTHKNLRTLSDPGGDPVTSLAFSPDGQILAAAAGSRCFLWDPATHKRIGTLSDPSGGSITSVAFGLDGQILVTGDSNGNLYLWNSANRNLIDTRSDRSGAGITSIAVSPDGKTIATGDGSGNTYLWNAATGKPVGSPLLTPSAVQVVAFSPAGKDLATCGSTCYLWTVAARKLTAKLDLPGGMITSVAFSPDGTTVAAASGRSTYLWNMSALGS
jgi:hypothetical protein